MTPGWGRLGIIGNGRAAKTLVHAWARAGVVFHWWVRSRLDTIEDLPEADTVLLAVSDDAIAEVANRLASRASAPKECWLHLSGVRPASVLRQSALIPRTVGGLHPLQALPGTPVPPEHLAGVTAGIEGEADACAIATQLAERLELVPRPLIADQKALYHAAAVTVAGHATALFSQAVAMLTDCGFAEPAARAALRPLMAGAVANLAKGPAEAVITGPAARGDAETILAHQRALLRRADVDGPDAANALGAARVYDLLAAEAKRLAGPSK